MYKPDAAGLESMKNGPNCANPNSRIIEIITNGITAVINRIESPAKDWILPAPCARGGQLKVVAGYCTTTRVDVLYLETRVSMPSV